MNYTSKNYFLFLIFQKKNITDYNFEWLKRKPLQAIHKFCAVTQKFSRKKFGNKRKLALVTHNCIVQTFKTCPKSKNLIRNAIYSVQAKVSVKNTRLNKKELQVYIIWLVYQIF